MTLIKSVLKLLLIVSLFGSLTELSHAGIAVFVEGSPVATKFRPAFAYGYLTNLAATNANELVPSIIWLTQDMTDNLSLDELKRVVVENLTKQCNAIINYVGQVFPTVHFSATAEEILKISAYDFVKYVDVEGDFIKGSLCLDVSVPAIRADVIAGFPNNGPYNGSGIKVAVLDTGINKTHPDLVGKVILEKDFTGENTTLDFVGHGTEIAGIIAGTGNASNSIYRGVAPGASILNARVVDSSGYPNVTWVTEGIEWAVDNGANIISLSIGYTNLTQAQPGFPWFQTRTDGTFEPSPIANEAVSHGVVFVAAAGNKDDPYDPINPFNPQGYVVAPADATGVIAVGAVDDKRTVSLQDDTMWPDSGQGPTLDGRTKPDVVAPGVNITSANAGFTSGKCYISDTGTSLATPLVAGMAALILQAHPGWTPTMVKSAIMSTAVLNDNLQSESENYRGKGIVDAERALKCAIDVQADNPDYGATSGANGHSEAVFGNGTIKTYAYGVGLAGQSLSIANLTKRFNLTSCLDIPTFTYGFRQTGSYHSTPVIGWAGLNVTMRLFNSSGQVLFSYGQNIHDFPPSFLGSSGNDANWFYQINYTYDGELVPSGSPYSIEYGFVAYAGIEYSYSSVTTDSLSVSIMSVQGFANPSFEERLNSVFVPADWLGNTSGWRELRGDIDGNGLVNGPDLNSLLASYGAHKGDSKYNWRTDLNGNGIVNGPDLNILLCDYGKQPTRLDGFYSWHVSSPGNFSMYQWICDYDVVSMRGKHVYFEFGLYTTGQCNTSIEVFYAYNGTTNTITSSNYQALLDWRLYYIDLVLPQNTTAVKLTIRDNTANLVACIDQMCETIA